MASQEIIYLSGFGYVDDGDDEFGLPKSCLACKPTCMFGEIIPDSEFGVVAAPSRVWLIHLPTGVRSVKSYQTVAGAKSAVKQSGDKFSAYIRKRTTKQKQGLFWDKLLELKPSYLDMIDGSRNSYKTGKKSSQNPEQRYWWQDI